jgi:hypothetical protein
MRPTAKPPARPPVPAAASVVGELAAIDASILARLVEIRAEQSRVEEFEAKAQRAGGDVPAAIRERVLEDYRTRARKLAADAAPLRARGRGEFARLKAVLDRVTAARDEATLARAELDFRRDVGELDEAEHAARAKEPDAVLDQCRSDLEAVAAVKAKFVEAFGGEEALDQAGPGEEPAAAPPAPAIGEPPPIPAAETVMDFDRTITGVPLPPKPPAAPDAAADVTRAIGRDALVLPPAAPAQPAPAAPPPAPVAAAAPAAGVGDEETTFLLPQAALLVADAATATRAEYRLAAVNYVGRSEENQIQLGGQGVSRQHALIAAHRRGFTLKDLGSQNGTFVNGVRITEQALADGDRICIGSIEMVFRSPWIAGSDRPVAG